MMIASLFILVFCPTVSFCDIVRDELWYDAEFSVVNGGRNMDEIVMNVNDVTFSECTLYCVKHLKCKSVNYNEEERMCEICDSEFDDDEALLDDRRWKNYGKPTKQHGRYSEWIDGQCSVTCGTGQKIQYRRCNKPPPRYGGDDCRGPFLQIVSCNSIPCPVDGNYTAWGPFTGCSCSCGLGKMIRSRNCTNPSPQHGGKDCTAIGKSYQTKECNLTDCLDLDYLIQTSGTCQSVSEEDCRRYSGARWAGMTNFQGYPTGCFHVPTQSKVYFNTNATKAPCRSTHECVCKNATKDYRVQITSQEICVSVSFEECGKYSESIGTRWRKGRYHGEHPKGCYVIADSVFYNNYPTPWGVCEQHKWCVCKP